jgi:hypothetical protein
MDPRLASREQAERQLNGQLNRVMALVVLYILGVWAGTYLLLEYVR